MAALTPKDQRRRKKVGDRTAGMVEQAGPRLTETPSAQAAQNRGMDQRALPDDTQIRGVQRDTMRDQEGLARRMAFMRRNTNLASDPAAFDEFERLRGEAVRNRDTLTATKRYFRGQNYDPAAAEANRQRLIEQSKGAAATMSDNLRMGAGTRLAAYDQHMGERRLGQMGTNVDEYRANSGAAPFSNAGPLGSDALTRYGSRLTQAERMRVDPTLAGGVDQRAALAAARDRDLADSQRLASLSMTGVTLPESRAPGGIRSDERQMIRQAALERRLGNRAEQVATTTGLRGQIAGAREGFRMDRASAGADIQGEVARGARARAEANRARVDMQTAERARELELARADSENRVAAAEAALAEAVDPAERARLESELQAAQVALVQSQGKSLDSQGAAAVTEADANADLTRAQAERTRVEARKMGEADPSGLDPLDKQLKEVQIKRAIDEYGVDPNGIGATTVEDDAVIAVSIENIGNSLNTLPFKEGTIDFGEVPTANMATVNTHIDKILRGLASDNALEKSRAVAAGRALIEATDAAGIEQSISLAPSLMSRVHFGAGVLAAIKRNKGKQVLDRFNNNLAQLRQALNAG